jgi:small subunit ribosomal protein S21|tara:strand:- start:1014 stop:1235 length:222 start_codon:yes stop_codon:yes gene_type:complete
MKHFKTTKIIVRNNNVDKALKVLKKKLTEEGLFNELREREHFMTRGEKRRRAKAAAKRRHIRTLEKRKLEEGY